MIIRGRIGLILVGLWVLIVALTTFVPALAGLGVLTTLLGVIGGICMIAGV